MTFSNHYKKRWSLLTIFLGMMVGVFAGIILFRFSMSASIIFLLWIFLFLCSFIGEEKEWIAEEDKTKTKVKP